MYDDVIDELPMGKIATPFDCANYFLKKLLNSNQEYQAYRIYEYDFSQLRKVYESNMDDQNIAVMYAKGFEILLPYFDVALAQLNMIETKELFTRFPTVKEIGEVHALSVAYAIKSRPDIHCKEVFVLKELADKYLDDFVIFQLYAEIVPSIDIQEEFQKREKVIGKNIEFAQYFAAVFAEMIRSSEFDDIESCIRILQKIEQISGHFYHNESLELVYQRSLVEICYKFAIEIENLLMLSVRDEESVSDDLDEMHFSIKDMAAIFRRLIGDSDDD